MLCEENKVTIIVGEKIDLELMIVDDDNRPKDLTGFDEIIFCIENADGSVLEKKLTGVDELIVTNLVLGEFKVFLLRADTLLLAVEENQSFDVRITNSTSGEDRTIKFERVLNIEAKAC